MGVLGIIIYVLMFLTAVLFAVGIINKQYSLLAATPVLLGILLFVNHRLLRDPKEELTEFETMKGIRKPLGELAVERGMINEKQLIKILKYSSKTKIPFGNAANKLKLLNKKQLIKLMAIQRKTDQG